MVVVLTNTLVHHSEWSLYLVHFPPSYNSHIASSRFVALHSGSCNLFRRNYNCNYNLHPHLRKKKSQWFDAAVEVNIECGMLQSAVSLYNDPALAIPSTRQPDSSLLPSNLTLFITSHPLAEQERKKKAFIIYQTHTNATQHRVKKKSQLKGGIHPN